MNGNGTAFTRTFYCEKDHQQRNSFNWPRQEEPTTSMKKVWKKALRKVFGLREGITTDTLGNWLHNDTNQWTWFYSPRTKSIYQRTGTTWKSWQREARRGREGTSSKYKYNSNCLTTPNNLERATVRYWTHNRITLEGSAPAHNDMTTTFSHSIQPNQLPINIIHDNLNI